MNEPLIDTAQHHPAIAQNFWGIISTAFFTVISIPLEEVNRGLTMVSLLIGIIVGSITAYRMFRHKETKEQTDRINQMRLDIDRLLQQRLYQDQLHGQDVTTSQKPNL